MGRLFEQAVCNLTEDSQTHSDERFWEDRMIEYLHQLGKYVYELWGTGWHAIKRQRPAVTAERVRNKILWFVQIGFAEGDPKFKDQGAVILFRELPKEHQQALLKKAFPDGWY
jgi:hypothetical protein